MQLPAVFFFNHTDAHTSSSFFATPLSERENKKGRNAAEYMYEAHLDRQSHTSLILQGKLHTQIAHDVIGVENFALKSVLHGSSL